MSHAECHDCGYDLTGLKPIGQCPECGCAYNTRSRYRQRRPEHFVSRHILPLSLGGLALVIFVVGVALSMLATNRVGFLLLTLIVSALPAFGAFTYWWSDRQDRKQGG